MTSIFINGQELPVVTWRGVTPPNQDGLMHLSLDCIDGQTFRFAIHRRSAHNMAGAILDFLVSSSAGLPEDLSCLDLYRNLEERLHRSVHLPLPCLDGHKSQDSAPQKQCDTDRESEQSTRSRT
jgi:hypothetical protein